MRSAGIGGHGGLAGLATTSLSPCVVISVVFLLIGIVVLDDYGITNDETVQRDLARRAAGYILGVMSLPTHWDKFYGVAFELPAISVEYALGIENTRAGWLVRHFLVHLSLLVGGICAYLLALRLFGSRLYAVIAMLLFLSHPRIYGHSFYNSKDIPFLGMFMVALYLVHWSFEKNNLRAFAMLGLAAGVLVNLRIMGVVLVAAVVAMRCVDVVSAGGNSERRRALATVAVFLAVCASIVYATVPALWERPIAGLIEWWRVLSSHPNNEPELYAGIESGSKAMPWHYLSVWFSITTPLFVILLAGLGACHVLCQSAKKPGDALGHTPLRFAAMVAGLAALIPLSAALLADNVYNGWRQFYFLYAPLSLLALFGMRWLASRFRKALWRISVPALAGAGIVANAASIASLHPYEHVYFNFLVDRRTPEHLGAHWTMDIWRHPIRHALEYLLQQDDDSTVAVRGYRTHWTSPIRENMPIMPRQLRERLVVKDDFTDFTIGPYNAKLHAPTSPYAQLAPVVHAIRVYDNTLYVVQASPPPHALSALLSAADSANRVVRDVFDVHLVEGLLVYVKEPCSAADIAGPFLLQYTPAAVDDLPPHRRRYGFDSLGFEFHVHGAKIGDRCIAALPIPGYPLRSINAGQWRPSGTHIDGWTRDEEPIWRVSFAPPSAP